MSTVRITVLKPFSRDDGAFARPGDVLEVHHADLAHYVQHGMGEALESAEDAKAHKESDKVVKAAEDAAKKPGRKPKDEA